MKTLATHPELVRAWLLAVAGMPLPPLQQARPQAAGPLPPPVRPYRR
jgi:hypothetical protein